MKKQYWTIQYTTNGVELRTSALEVRASSAASAVRIWKRNTTLTPKRYGQVFALPR